MKLRTLSLVSLAAATAFGCGGSSQKLGTPDEISRKHAMQASFEGSEGAAKGSKKDGTALQWAMSFSGQEDSQDLSFSENCEKGGSVSGKVTSLIGDPDAGAFSADIEANFNKCASDEDGSVSGSLKISIAGTETAMEMTLDGKVDGLGKNAEGLMAPHSIEFKDVSLVVNLDAEDDFAQIACTGTLVVDGKTMTCAEAMSGKTNALPQVVGAQKSFFKENIGDMGTLAFVFEVADKTVTSINQVTLFLVGGANGYLSSDDYSVELSFGDEERDNLLDLFSVIPEPSLATYSPSAALVLVQAAGGNVEEVSHLVVNVTLSDGTTVDISSQP